MELRKRKTVSRVKKMVLMFFLGMPVLTAAIVFGLFHIREVDVVGNEFYTAQEIQKMVMSGSLAENSLYLTWKYRQEDAAENLPFLNAVEVSLVNPYHIEIRVYEKTIAGYVMFSGNRVYFDTDGTVVEISGEEREGISPFSGIAIGQPVVGEKLPVEDEAFLSDIVEASRLIHQAGLLPDELHYDERHQLILYFGESRILMGTVNYLEDKIASLQALYPELEGLSGTLHMENFDPGTTTISFKIDEHGEEESELIINLNRTPEETAENAEGEPGSDTASGEEETDGAEEAGTTSASGYVEDPGRITTGADGSQVYTDPLGNVTPNLDKQYLGPDGEVITDGYGYIDPYTGAYILN